MAGWKKAAKKVEKKVFGSKGFKGRYGIGKGKGGLKILQIAKDLEMVKSRLNVEKHHIDSDVFTGSVAQVDGNNDGALFLSLTPQITQGVGEAQRVGNSIKVTGLTMPIQINGAVNTLSARKLRVSILRITSGDNGVSPQEAFEKVWDVNPLSAVRDYHCNRNYRTSKQDGISVIYSKSFYLKPPSLDNGASGADQAEVSQLSFRVNLKMNDTIRYLNNAAIDPDGMRYYLVIQSDLGNRNVSVLSTRDVPVKTVDSGVGVRIHTRFWYVDN